MAVVTSTGVRWAKNRALLSKSRASRVAVSSKLLCLPIRKLRENSRAVKKAHALAFSRMREMSGL
ncbi:MAG: hypothetical protein WAN05_26395 [Roseiarcus sp.]